ncbi:MAG: hypothetical protein RL264_2712 [Bacteroidota bacterium]|jgi:hypothetical protein
MRLLSLIFILALQVSYGQMAVGSWKHYFGTAKAIDVAASNTAVYTAFTNGLFILDLSSSPYEKSAISSVNGLSDLNISCLFWDEVDNSLLIGYANGNIDKLKNGIVYNIPALKLASVSGSKRINRFYRHGNFVYTATDLAILVLNLSKNEVKDTYYATNSMEKVADVTILNDTLFAITPSRLLRASLQNPAITAASQWSLDTRIPTLTNHFYHEIESLNGDLYVLFKKENYGEDTVYRLSNSGKTVVSNMAFTLEINSISTVDEYLAMNTFGGSFLYNSNNEMVTALNSYNLGLNLNTNRLIKNSTSFWMADEFNGLYQVFNEFAIKSHSIEGPRNDEFYSMDWQDGKWAIASGRLQMKVPAFTKNGLHLKKDNQWTLLNADSITPWQTSNFWDILDASINPKNLNQIAISSYSKEPLSVINDGVATLYNNSNSTLEISGIGNGWTLVSDVCYDRKNNLWALNGYAQRPLNVLDKNGVWRNFYCGSNAVNIYTTKMIVDTENNIWFATLNDGLFGYNYNKTLDNESDDKFIQLNTGSSTGALPSNNVTALAYDKDGELWVGTDNGFGILYGASRAFNATAGNYNLQRIKVKFEGNVEYVLGNTYISDIEVDGGNRKWVGTANAGIILLSSDGSEIIEQHTTSNSPLISDNIFDLKLDQSTGELFVLTDKGLVSYRTSATADNVDYSDVVVFPNPVRPNYNGLVTIQGIRYDSDVKITDVAGNLIYKTTSNGGTATWNGETFSGQRVAAGVYLIWTATNTESDKKVGKVMVIR